MTAENAPQASKQEDEVKRDYIKTSLKYLHQVLNHRDEVCYWWRGHSGYSEFYRFKTNLEEWRDQLFAYWLDEKDQLLSGKNGPFFLVVQGDAEIWVERDLVLKKTTSHPKELAPQSVAKEPVQEQPSVAKEPEKKKDVDRITISKHEYDLLKGVKEENNTLRTLIEKRDHVLRLHEKHIKDLTIWNEKLKLLVKTLEEESKRKKQEIQKHMESIQNFLSNDFGDNSHSNESV